MSNKSVKPNLPQAIIPGRYQTAKPESGSSEPKPISIPGARVSAAPLNKNPEVAERIRDWRERRNRKRGGR